MDLITRLKIRGFRRLADVDVTLGPLNFVIGPNGSGKSSFIDALEVLGRSAKGELKDALIGLGGLDRLVTAGSDIGITFRSRMTIDAAEYEYLITIKSTQTRDYTLGREYFGLRESWLDESGEALEAVRTNFNVSKPKMGETFISELWKKGPLEVRIGVKILAEQQTARSIHAEKNAPIRNPQQLRPIEPLDLDGSTLFSFLHGLREADRDRYDLIIESLRAGFPSLQELGFPAVAAGMVSMTWKDANFKTPFYMNELSEGTLRFLWMVCLLLQPELPKRLLIEEPEVGLHPRLLSILVDLMREASERCQIIVATHSDRMISYCKPEEVIVIDNDDEGMAVMKNASDLNLSEWLKDYTMGDLWQMGRLDVRD